MLRHLGLIAVCASIGASVGCGGKGIEGITPTPPVATVTVEFGGRVVNADAGGPVGNVRVSLSALSSSGGGLRLASADETATSGGDGTFTLPLDLPMGWRGVYLKLTAPPGYDNTNQGFEPTTAADRPAIRMYPTLVIRPGESIEVRVDSSIVWCGWDGYACRRVLVAASPGESVELEVVSHDSSKPMALGLANPANPYNLEPDMSVRRLIVPPGGVPYVIGDYPTGTATLTARR
jgi:hypothetical protein